MATWHPEQTGIRPPAAGLLTTASPTRPLLAPNPVGLGVEPPPKGRGPAEAGAGAGVNGLAAGGGAGFGWKPPLLTGAAGFGAATWMSTHWSHRNRTIVSIKNSFIHSTNIIYLSEKIHKSLLFWNIFWYDVHYSFFNELHEKLRCINSAIVSKRD